MFQRLMDFVLCGLSYMTCLVYLDDIIIFGKSFEEQLARLREVFSRIRSANLKLKPIKCSLFRRSVSFLGHIKELLRLWTITVELSTTDCS